MELKANNYEPRYIFRIIREWTNLTQRELCEVMNKKGRAWVKNIEAGLSRYYFADILEISNKFNISIIFTKNNNQNPQAPFNEFKANDYTPKEIFKMLRHWTNLTQEELGLAMNKKGRAWAKNIERGKCRYFFSDVLSIAKKFDITITFKK